MSLVGGTGTSTSITIHGLTDLHGGVLGLVDGFAELGGISVSQRLVLVEILEGVDGSLDLFDLLRRQLAAELVKLLLGVEVCVFGFVLQIDEFLS